MSLDETLGRRLAEHREANGRSKNEVVRQAFDEFLPTADESEYVLLEDPKLREATSRSLAPSCAFLRLCRNFLRRVVRHRHNAAVLAIEPLTPPRAGPAAVVVAGDSPAEI